jgi:quercetin dioxygenase-like cupin family protein
MFGALISSLRVPELMAARRTDCIVPSESDTRAQTLLQKELLDLKEEDSAVSLSVIRVEYAAGAKSRPHIHPCPAFVYVVRGTIESQLEGEEKLACIRRGSIFFEPARRRDLIARNASSGGRQNFWRCPLARQAPL